MRRSGHLDLALAAVLCAVGELEVAGLWYLGGIGVPDRHASRLLEALLVLAATGALVWRRSFPFAALTVTVTAVCIQVTAVTPSVSLLAGLLPLLVGTFTVAAHRTGAVRIAGLLMSVATQAVFTAMIAEERAPNECAFGLIVIAGSWLIGAALSHRLRRLDEVATQTVAEERARIARELHDVISHGVSVMGVQSAAARLIMDREPERAKRILLGVEGQAREAIDELQRLLSVLRGDDEATDRQPQPGLGDLPRLIARMQQAGLRVDLAVDGDAQPLPAGADLTAYRIVQEALTNILKHAGPVDVVVRLTWGPHELGIEVSDLGARITEQLLPGHGLIGMRERVALYGGTVHVEARRSGGVTVEANLPVGTS